MKRVNLNEQRKTKEEKDNGETEERITEISFYTGVRIDK
jgi:hypothetical protein